MTSRAAPVTISRRRLFFVMVALFTSMLLAALDQTIFGTALPTIVGELDGVEQMLWVATAYILASTMMMPVYGKLGDLIGHKVLLLSALGLFLVGSVLGGLAHNMSALIAARGIQGLGGGGLMILSPVDHRRHRAAPAAAGIYMGIMIGAWSFASVLGPILGGWFADTIGWRWAFWFNLPLGVLAIVFVAAFLKTPAHKKARPALDGLGHGHHGVCTTAISPGHLLGRAPVRLEFGPHPGPHRPGGGRGSRSSSWWRAGRPSPSCRCTCSATATSTWPPSPACSAPPPSSEWSSTCPPICRWPPA